MSKNFAQLQVAIRLVAGTCDGAQQPDGTGFNRHDADKGHRLAETPDAQWSLADAVIAHRILQKYSKQLENAGIAFTDIEEPAQTDTAAWIEKEHVILSFPYDASIVATIKTLPQRYFNNDNKTWAVPVEFARNVVDALPDTFDISPQLQTLADTLTPAPVRPVERIIDIDDSLFTIAFPYDEQLVASVRQLPNRRWDKPRSMWTVSSGCGVPKAIRDFAARHDFQVTKQAQILLAQTGQTQLDNLDASAATAGSIIVPRLQGKLHPFQQAGVQYALENKRCLIADEMGCVDGNAIVNINRAGKGMSITLEQLYHRFHASGIHRGRNWDPGIPTYVRCLKNTMFGQHPIINVLAKGKHDVLELKLASGKTLKVTPDHEIRLFHGTYIDAASLCAGDIITTNGTEACQRCGHTGSVATYRYARFRGFCRTCIYRYMRHNRGTGSHLDSDGYVRTSGQHHHPHHRAGYVLEHRLVAEKTLGRYLTDDEVVHHIDGNKTNNKQSNLCVMSKYEHALVHGRAGGIAQLDGGYTSSGQEIIIIPRPDTLLSIEPAPPTNVYDIVCEDPHRNFVANGIVVHNCGKTMQALATTEAADAYPAVIVCPAIVKYNWQREIDKWLPHRTTCIINKKTDDPAPADFTILNYDILPAHVDHLKTTNPNTVILDESHYAKNAKSQRSKACRKLTKNVDYRLLLSGTPIMNRPIELVHQLQIMDRLSELGGWKAFTTRYCNPQYSRFGTDLRGASNLDELAQRLRQTCMIRRTKAQVLPELPDKQRSIVNVSLSNLDEYQTAERNLLVWLEEAIVRDKKLFDQMLSLPDDQANELIAKAIRSQQQAALEAEFLVKMSTLRQLVAHGKLPAISSWISNFIESSDQKLVVFAHHRSLQSDLLSAFPNSLALLSKQSNQQRQQQVDAFQNDPTKQLIIASLKAAGIGITLTAASNVLFTELDWTPATHDQAEDRCHRIGTKNAVNCYYALAQNTIDDVLWDKLENKRAITTNALQAFKSTPLNTASLIKTLRKRHS